MNGVTHNDVYTYEQGDKLVGISRNGASWRTYAYNDLGETTSITEGSNVTTFNWNNDGRVTSMDLPGTTNDPAYAYNGLGTRVSRTVGSSTVNWKRSGAEVSENILSDGPSTFTPGISTRVGALSTFTHGGIKNTTAQSEGFTGFSATKTFDAFGLTTSESGIWKPPFGYGGSFGYQGTDAGMMLLGHRYYDPETGRFLSRDPIKDGRNWYVYCNGSPLTAADPEGLAPKWVKNLQQGVMNFLDSAGHIVKPGLKIITIVPAVVALGIAIDHANTEAGQYMEHKKRVEAAMEMGLVTPLKGQEIIDVTNPGMNKVAKVLKTFWELLIEAAP